MKGPVATLAAVVAIVLAACGTVASSGASGAPGASPGPDVTPASSWAPGTIEHERGAADVVFRFEEGGGFVPIGFFATEAPMFTLYGDGTVIFRDSTAAPPSEAAAINRMPAFRWARLSEEQVQSFLRDAIADGGLGVARDFYEGPGADLPTATFTITVAGTTKRVSVMALGMDRGDGPDALVLRALAGLGDRVRDVGREIETGEVWVPDRWRGVLTADALNPPRPWPWTSITPADFVQRGEPDAPGFPIRTMTPEEIDLLSLDGIEGGFSGLSLAGPDGRTYLFALRPLLPDEAY